MRLKLFPKFLLILTLLSVLPALIVGIRTIRINREGMQAAILELHTHLASSLAENAQDYLGGIEREIQYVIKMMGARMDWTDRQSVIQSLLDTNENLASVSIVDKDGRELLKAYNPQLEKDPRLLSRKGDETFETFTRNRSRSAISGAYFIEDDPRINIIYPLGEEHCLYVTVSLKTLWNKITQTRIASTGHAFMVNDKGAIIAHPQAELAAKHSIATDLPVVQQVMKAVTVGSSEYVHPKTGAAIVGAYAPVKALSWGIIVQQDKKEAYMSVYQMRRQATILIVASILAACTLAVIIAGGLTRPLMRLTQAARHIADRDFAARVNVRTGDELQDLAETFNAMTAELQRYDQMQVDKIVEEKTKTESIIFSIADGILMTDSEGKLQLANTPAKSILSLPENGWQNMPVWQFINNDSLRLAFDEIIKEPGQDISREVDLSQNELLRYYKLSSQEVITPEKKEKIGVVTVMRNVTLEKELEKMKDDFLHSITHDLRNPMTSIRGFLKFLLDGVGGTVNEQQHKMLETMDRASNRLMGLINDILDIAKLESGRMVLNLGLTDLRAVAKRTLELAEGQALKKSIQLAVEAPENLPSIFCDADLMDRVFTNLVGNALKFTPENGKVSITFEDSPDMLRMAVVDTGEGIPPEYIDKVFDKFQQVTGQRKGGTGLGLTICRHITEAHMGKIWAESAIGRGTKMVFTIPRNLTPDLIQVRLLKTTSNETKPS
ncbi:MAG: hypothetical protein A2219_02125 [Elusimicrobia bacterium RIFOXYA2_FULL_50_26]|nr:MAG: hypothetical protein A2219_02125 [Elusimicrobia bacterium RIFOXYA2_FULL_50_26]OGS23501.1 MAG: hypothetical protein A2314_05595 [Elusimicrobia bacterium RIFOXYB2_FULL_50_12]